MITVDMIKERLLSLGYTAEDNDTFTLNFLQKKEENYVKHFCNITTIPSCLDPVIIDKICSDFLTQKKAIPTNAESGNTNLNTATASGAVKKITDGDTTVEFDTSSSSSGAVITFDSMIKELTKSYEDELIRHRRLSW